MHRVIRGYWPYALIDQCKAEVDSISNWRVKGSKSLCNRDFPEAIASVIATATAPEFINQFIGYGLVPDPEFNGGGVHSTKAGGWLGMHRDFNYLPKLGWRVSNLLLYLNRSWSGGDLLVNGDRISPEANTMVILSPEDWHGHPEPCGERRDSIALYYYSQEKPLGVLERPVTDYEWTETTK